MGKVVKRLLLILGIIILLIVVGTFSMCTLIDKRNKTYWKYNKSDMPIESKYIPLGELETDYVEYSASGVCKKYEISYPKELENSSKKYPLVVMANGTGVKASQYKEVFTHLASWGFIVIGNEDDNSRSGKSSSDSLDFMLQKNADKEHLFYNKVDTDNIGISGHSQGGVGALNAVTEQANGNIYKAVWAASTTSRYHAKELSDDKSWNCYPSKINIPCFMIAGTKNMDAGNMKTYTESLSKGEAQGICPLWWLNECYDAMTANTKIIARFKDKDHGDMLRCADGYMTAWFIYHLQGDVSADFFSGNNAEIKSNKNWQDVKI